VCGPAADSFEKFLYPFALSFVLNFGEFGKFVRIISLEGFIYELGWSKYIGRIFGWSDISES